MSRFISFDKISFFTFVYGQPVAHAPLVEKSIHSLLDCFCAFVNIYKTACWDFDGIAFNYEVKLGRIDILKILNPSIYNQTICLHLCRYFFYFVHQCFIVFQFCWILHITFFRKYFNFLCFLFFAEEDTPSANIC